MRDTQRPIKHGCYEEVESARETIADLRSWLDENPSVTHAYFSKMVLNENNEKFLLYNLFNCITSDGMRIIPLVEEFLIDEKRQEFLRRTGTEMFHGKLVSIYPLQIYSLLLIHSC